MLSRSVILPMLQLCILIASVRGNLERNELQDGKMHQQQPIERPDHELSANREQQDKTLNQEHLDGSADHTDQYIGVQKNRTFDDDQGGNKTERRTYRPKFRRYYDKLTNRTILEKSIDGKWQPAHPVDGKNTSADYIQGANFSRFITLENGSQIERRSKYDYSYDSVRWFRPTRIRINVSNSNSSGSLNRTHFKYKFGPKKWYNPFSERFPNGTNLTYEDMGPGRATYNFDTNNQWFRPPKNYKGDPLRVPENGFNASQVNSRQVYRYGPPNGSSRYQNYDSATNKWINRAAPYYETKRLNRRHMNRPYPYDTFNGYGRDNPYNEPYNYYEDRRWNHPYGNRYDERRLDTDREFDEPYAHRRWNLGHPYSEPYYNRRWDRPYQDTYDERRWDRYYHADEGRRDFLYRSSRMQEARSHDYYAYNEPYENRRREQSHTHERSNNGSDIYEGRMRGRPYRDRYDDRRYDRPYRSTYQDDGRDPRYRSSIVDRLPHRPHGESYEERKWKFPYLDRNKIPESQSKQEKYFIMEYYDILCKTSKNLWKSHRGIRTILQDYEILRHEEMTPTFIPVLVNNSMSMLSRLAEAVQKKLDGNITVADINQPIDRGTYARTLNNFDKMTQYLREYVRSRGTTPIVEELMKKIANYKQDFYVVYSDISHMVAVLRRTMKRYGFYVMTSL